MVCEDYGGAVVKDMMANEYKSIHFSSRVSISSHGSNENIEYGCDWRERCYRKIHK